MERSSVGLSRKFRVLLVRMQLLKTIGRAKISRDDALERTSTRADGQRTGTAERKIDLDFMLNDESSIRDYNSFRKERVGMGAIFFYRVAIFNALGIVEGSCLELQAA